MPPAIPGAGPLQMIPSGSSNNLYTLNSPTDINTSQGEDPVLSQQPSMMPSVNPYGVPYAAPAPAAPRYTYTRYDAITIFQCFYFSSMIWELKSIII